MRRIWGVNWRGGAPPGGDRHPPEAQGPCQARAVPEAASSRATVFSPFRLGPLTLRNRVVKSATFEGMSRGGLPSAELVAFHRRLAAGGVALTTVAYGAVSPDARTFDTQMWLSPDTLPGLRRLTDAVHAEGGAAAIQLTHCGGFSKSARARTLGGPLAPSFGLNALGVAHGIPFTRAMSERDIETVVDDFGRGAAHAIEAGFDALEVHLGHGYLLSQFLSPATNRRRDRFGGSLEGRLRLPLAVVARVLEVAAGRVPVLAKTNLSDGFAGGLELPEAIEIAQALERAGVSAIVPSGGFTSKTPFFLLRGERPLRQMIEVDSSALQRMVLRTAGRFIIRAHPFEELFFLPMPCSRLLEPEGPW